MKRPALLLAALLAAAAAPAEAVTLQYTLTGTDTDGTVEFASFQVDQNPVPLPNNVAPGEGFRLKFLSGVFRYGSTVASLQDVQFFSAALNGGFINLDPTDKVGSSAFLLTVGPQLYSGPEAAPTLLPGGFTLFDLYSGAPLALNVAAVPEPAGWAMMIAGLATAGGALRRRRAARRAAAGAGGAPAAA